MAPKLSRLPWLLLALAAPSCRPAFGQLSPGSPVAPDALDASPLPAKADADGAAEAACEAGDDTCSATPGAAAAANDGASEVDEAGCDHSTGRCPPLGSKFLWLPDPYTGSGAGFPIPHTPVRPVTPEAALLMALLSQPSGLMCTRRRRLGGEW